MGSTGFWLLARQRPDWIAAVDPDGTEHAAAALLARVNQVTHGLRELGLRPGDGIVTLLPNGVRRPLAGLSPEDAAELGCALLQFFGIVPGPPGVHLVTSPNYHTAVTLFAGASLHMGHTLVCMGPWDAEETLAKVDRYQVTSTHMVPTQFKRMLMLPEPARRRYNLSSMRWLIHA